jgi:hypothetical protein
MRELWSWQEPALRLTGLTGGPRVRVELRSPCEFRVVKRILCGARHPQPINIKGHCRLRWHHPIDHYFLQLLSLIKVPRLSNVFDKVCFTSNSQLYPIFVFNSFISDSIINNSKRSIEDDLLVSDSMPLDSTSQCIVKIKKADHKNTLTFKFSKLSLSKFFSSWCTYGYSRFKSKKSKSRDIVKFDAHIVTNFKASGMRSAKKGIAKWVDEKSERFVCLALKPSPQKHRLEK